MQCGLEMLRVAHMPPNFSNTAAAVVVMVPHHSAVSPACLTLNINSLIYCCAL